jgi:hypothetical protein
METLTQRTAQFRAIERRLLTRWAIYVCMSTLMYTYGNIITYQVDGKLFYHELRI